MKMGRPKGVYLVLASPRTSRVCSACGWALISHGFVLDVILVDGKIGEFLRMV